MRFCRLRRSVERLNSSCASIRLRAFQRLELPHDFRLAAFLQRGGDGAFQFVDVHRLGQAVMGAARALQRVDLLMHFQRAGNDDDGDEGQQFLELRQKIQAQFAVGQDVVENERGGACSLAMAARASAAVERRASSWYLPSASS